MKQKFLLLKSEDKSEILIQEFSELDSGIYTMVCEESFNAEVIQRALDNQGLLFKELRTNNIFPPVKIMEKIINALPKLFDSDGEPVEVFFEDTEVITSKSKHIVLLDSDDDDDVEVEGIDTLLDTDDDDLNVKTSDPIDASIDDISIDDGIDDIIDDDDD